MTLPDDVHQFVWTQHSITVGVQRVKTPPDVFLATHAADHLHYLPIYTQGELTPQ